MILRSLDESSSDLTSEFGSLDFLNYTREFTNGWRAQMMGLGKDGSSFTYGLFWYQFVRFLGGSGF